MMLAVAIIAAVAWLLGYAIFHVASGTIHVLIIVAAIALVVHLLYRRRRPFGGGGAIRGGY